MVIYPSGLKNAQLTSAGELLQGSGPIEQDLIHGHLQLGHSLGLQQGAGFKFFQPSASLSWKIRRPVGHFPPVVERRAQPVLTRKTSTNALRCIAVPPRMTDREVRYSHELRDATC
jgi:hypothetical protein